MTVTNARKVFPSHEVGLLPKLFIKYLLAIKNSPTVIYERTALYVAVQYNTLKDATKTRLACMHAVYSKLHTP